jgi:hypothetical protein
VQQPYGQPAFGPPGGYGQQLPLSINIASILLFVSGGFGVLGALLLFAVGAIVPIFAVLAIVLLAVSAAEIYTGLQLRKFMPWARTATIVLAGVGALLSVFSLFHGAFSSIIGIGLDAYVIYLMYQPDTLRAFPASTRPGGI